jgi:lipopolysaccharide/colanic/teichoic acid biosynthesis glycosyltransferase
MTVKRIIDVIVSVMAIVVASPVLLACVIAVKMSGEGPVLFRQERAGRDGVPFTFLKFRTMRAGVDAFGPSPKSAEDPRLTRTGRFLREISLDELPQLFNVLKGDMSIVGPRPLYLSQIPEWNDRQRNRLLVKPGITGLAQVSGRGELTREEKLELDVKYVENRGLGQDLKIMALTVWQVFCRKEIYEKKYSTAEGTRGESVGNSP